MRFGIKRLNLYPAVIQSVRLLLSVATASLLAHLCKLNEPYWALITAVIVTQSRIAQTLQTSRDQIIGSLIGGIAGIIAIALQIYCGWSPIIVFTIVMIPMVMFVSWRPTMRLGVVTLAVVFLFPSPGGIFERPFDRIFSIVVGVLASLLVSYCILRPQARYHAFLHAQEAFSKLYKLLHAVLIEGISWDAVEAKNDEIITELRELASDIDEARKERPTCVLEETDPVLVQLFPILRRLQSDSIFVARAMEAYGQKLHPNTEKALEHALKEIFYFFKIQSVRQANGKHKKLRNACDIHVDFNSLLNPLLEEAKKSCPSIIQFTLKALCNDFCRGHDIFSS